MLGILVKIAAFIGTIVAAIIPAIGREIRRNDSVRQIGADDETRDTLDRDILDATRRNRVRASDVEAAHGTVSRRSDSDNEHVRR